MDVDSADESQTEPFIQPGEATWQNCDHLDQLQQVLIKEQAVEDAQNFIDKLEWVLRRYSSRIKNVKKWLSRICRVFLFR